MKMTQTRNVNVRRKTQKLRKNKKRNVNCTNLYKSDKVQAELRKAFKKSAAQLIKETGGLPKFYWRDFKKGFKNGFMDTCKTQKKN